MEAWSSCIDFAKDFIVSGTASDQLFGTCESLWEPDMEPEDLFETISQSLLNSVDRDALSGWGAHVYVVTKDKVIKRLLKGSYTSPRTDVDVWLTWWLWECAGRQD
jgi:20S proteasome subunit beta 3